MSLKVERLNAVGRRIVALVSNNKITGTKTYLLDNGDYYVEPAPDSYLWKFKVNGYRPYEKAEFMGEMKNLGSNIARPKSLVKIGRDTVGFIVPPLGDDENVSLHDYFMSVPILEPGIDASIALPKYDFAPRTEVFTKLENTIKSEPRIVFPDIASKGNVLVDSNGEVYVVDIGGMQVDDRFMADSYSTFAEGITEFDRDKNDGVKYFLNGNPFHHTKELDKASLISLYFETVFDQDVNQILGRCGTSEERTRMIEELFNLIGFENEDALAHALWKIWEPIPNDWLGDIVPSIADKYKIVSQRPIAEDVFSGFFNCNS